ncbi:hypothetical protein Sjap_020248 [Stephania japonica]|uniref:WAT1-related protein n=1 Tax=Stephania japonica TaxID=461633 RepID=A0AAP0F119_9MAGN
MNSEYLKEFAVLGGLVTIQLVFAVYGVLTSRVMALGLSPYFLIIYGSFATFLFYSPLSFIFERKKWPSKLGMKLLGQFVLISFGGVTVSQWLLLIGLKRTTPAVAAAMPNISPGLIFIISWIFRFEKVNLKCLYSKIKILGTLLCIIGAILMSLLYASASKSISTSPKDAGSAIDNDKIIGTLCLMSAVIIFSSLVVLQATILAELPAPISICAVTAFIGSVLTAILQLIQEHNLVITSPFMSKGKLIVFALSGGIVGGGCNSFGSWAMKEKGPVFVSTFGPIGTVFSVTISAVTLGDIISLGSLIGMFVMFTGLYLVLFAKKKEGEVIDEPDAFSRCDVEKPLLN